MLCYANGNSQAFAVLLRRYEKKILNFIFRSVGHRERAEELTQDVFMRVIRSAKKYKPTAKFTTWLYTIARNICIDESRRQARKKTLSLDDSISKNADSKTFLDQIIDTKATAGAASLARARFIERLRLALLKLPIEQRQVFVLRHYNGLKFREIAELSGVSDNTVKSRMRYALQALQHNLADLKEMSFDEFEQEFVRPKDAPKSI